MESIIVIIIIVAIGTVLGELITQIFSTIRTCSKNKYEYMKLKEANIGKNNSSYDKKEGI